MLYYLDGIEMVDEGQLSALMPYLSEERDAYQRRYRFFHDRRQSVLAYLLLRIALLEEYGIRQIPKLHNDDRGKPYLTEYPEICFNLSHCKKAVACAVGKAPLGVDVQEYVPFKESLASYFMTAEELAAAKADASGREFSRIWSLKESYGKYKGFGICYDMPKYAVAEGLAVDGSLSKSHLLQDFVVSVTSREPMDFVRLPLWELLQKCAMLDRR